MEVGSGRTSVVERPSGAATATASTFHRASVPSAKSGGWIGMWPGAKESVASAIGERSAARLLCRLPSAAKAALAREDYARETSG